jgi:hypothetical protein
MGPRWCTKLLAAAALLGHGCGRIGFDVAAGVDLDFTRDVLPPELVFARSSPATYVDATGVLQSVPGDVPRFDHDPVSGAPLGLLIEPAGRNLLKYSAQLDGLFSGGGWFINGAGTVVPDVALAPDGTQTADRFSDNDTAFCRIAIGADVPDDTQIYTYSVFVKDESLGRFSLGAELLNGSVLLQHSVTFDLATRQITVNTSGILGTGITAFPDGWSRVWITQQNNAKGNVVALLSVERNDTLAATGSVLAWGAQLEPGSWPSSYIPTDTSAAARAADLVSATSTAWFRPDAGTVRVEADVAATTDQRTVFCADASPAGSMCLVRPPVEGAPTLELVAAGSAQARLVGGSWPVAPRIVAWSYATDDVALSDSGAPAILDLSAQLPGAYTALSFGTDMAGLRALGGHLARFTFTPHLPDADLATISQ